MGFRQQQGFPRFAGTKLSRVDQRHCRDSLPERWVRYRWHTPVIVLQKVRTINCGTKETLKLAMFSYQVRPLALALLLEGMWLGWHVYASGILSSLRHTYQCRECLMQATPPNCTYPASSVVLSSARLGNSPIPADLLCQPIFGMLLPDLKLILVAPSQMPLSLGYRTRRSHMRHCHSGPPIAPQVGILAFRCDLHP